MIAYDPRTERHKKLTCMMDSRQSLARKHHVLCHGNILFVYYNGNRVHTREVCPRAQRGQDWRVLRRRTRNARRTRHARTILQR